MRLSNRPPGAAFRLRLAIALGAGAVAALTVGAPPAGAQAPEALASVVGRPGGPPTVSQPLVYYVSDPRALATSVLLQQMSAPASERPVVRPTTRLPPAPRPEPEEARAGEPSPFERRVRSLLGGGKRHRPPQGSTFGAPRAPAGGAGAGLAGDSLEVAAYAAVGRDHAIQVSGSAIEFKPRSATPRPTATRAPLTSFFRRLGCPLPASASAPEARAIYDQHAGRFVVAAAARSDSGLGDPADDSRILLAVSDDADPAGVWNCTSIPSTVVIDGLERRPDSPAIAIDEEAVYVTASMFAFSAGGGAFAGTRLWVIDKLAGDGGGLYTPGGAATVTVSDPVPPGGFAGTMRPARVFGSPPRSPDVGTWLVLYDGLTYGGPRGAEVMQVVRLDNPVGPGVPTFSGPYFVPLGDVDDFARPELPAAPHRGGTRRLDTGDRRVGDAVWRDGHLYAAITVAARAGVPGAGEATVRWVVIDTRTPGAPVAVDGGALDGEAIAPGAHTFSPSIAVNAAGEVAIGFLASAATTFPASAWAYRRPADAPGRTRTPIPAESGPGEGSGNPRCPAAGEPRARGRAPAGGVWVDPANDQCFVIRGAASAADCGAGAFRTVCTCAETLALEAGTGRELSLPCSPGLAGTVAEVLADDLEGAYGVDWTVSRPDPATGGDVELRPTDPLLAGEGYRIVTRRTGQAVTVEGAGNSAAGIPLLGAAAAPPAGCAGSAGRCNLVGNPHRSEVCWADARVADGAVVMDLAAADPANACQTDGAGCVLSRLAHVWTGAGYAPFDGVTPGMEGTLEAWDAFRVSANRLGLDLLLPVRDGGCRVAAAASGSANESMAAARPDRPPWFIRLIATSGALVDSSNVLGQAATSNDGYDAFDLQELDPFGNDYLTIVFPHPDWGAQAGNYASDFHSYKTRQGPEVWSFEVRSSDPSATVTVTWEGPPSRIRRSQLLDAETGTTLLATAGGSYEFTMTGPSRAFTWTVWPHRATRPGPLP